MSRLVYLPFISTSQILTTTQTKGRNNIEAGLRWAPGRKSSSRTVSTKAVLEAGILKEVDGFFWWELKVAWRFLYSLALELGAEVEGVFELTREEAWRFAHGFRFGVEVGDLLGSTGLSTRVLRASKTDWMAGGIEGGVVGDGRRTWRVGVVLLG